MFTVVSIPKPFHGHIGMIQRNALRSWMALDGADVLLLGDDDGVAEAAAEIGARHAATVAKSPHGTPLVSSAFALARELSDQSRLLFVNADILLLPDFSDAVATIELPSFLLVGQRWNVDVREPIAFEDPHWADDLRAAALASADLSNHHWIDYFMFPRESPLIDDFPPFVVGRPMWDNWLLRRARRIQVPLIDGTRMITALHQRHDYTHVPQGTGHHWEGPEAAANTRLFGGGEIYGIHHATHVLTRRGPAPALSTKYLRKRWETRYEVDGRFERLCRVVDPLLAPGRLVYRRWARSTS